MNDSPIKLLVQQRSVKNHGKWTTRYSFPLNKSGQALRYYQSLNAHSGWAKRLVRIDPDGSTSIYDRQEDKS